MASLAAERAPFPGLATRPLHFLCQRPFKAGEAPLLQCYAGTKAAWNDDGLGPPRLRASWNGHCALTSLRRNEAPDEKIWLPLSLRGRVVRVGRRGAGDVPFRGCIKHHKTMSSFWPAARAGAAEAGPEKSIARKNDSLVVFVLFFKGQKLSSMAKKTGWKPASR